MKKLILITLLLVSFAVTASTDPVISIKKAPISKEVASFNPQCNAGEDARYCCVWAGGVPFCYEK